MRKFEDVFREATGESLQPGTLNVKMDRAVPFRAHFQINRLDGDEWGWQGPMLFEICRIDKIWAYRIKGGHMDPLLVEISCAQRIHKVSGDHVDLEFFGD
jgi:hypothetical protein